MVTRHDHNAAWTPPLPLWEPGPGSAAGAPSILRFATDSFMAELKTKLASQTIDLTPLLLRAESWRNGVQAGKPAWDQIPPDDPKLVPKLYQPAHGRFYLVAASLVCEIPGYPDRHLEPNAGEKVSFVVRRLYSGQEYAWIPGDGWRQAVAPATALVKGEERQALFPMGFTQDGQRRRLFAGLIPTASSDTYAAAKALESPFSDLLADYNTMVLSLWTATGSSPLPAAQAQKLLGGLKNFLEQYLPRITPLVQTPNGDEENLLVQAERNLLAVLRQTVDGTSLATQVANPPAAGQMASGFHAVLTTLGARVKEYGDGLPVPPLPKLGADEEYIIRCAFERPCAGNWQGEVLSARSGTFRFASFFDSDAPQRQTRITMPFDLPEADSPKALGVLASQKMRNEMERFRAIKGMKKEEFEGTSPGTASLGMICSLSIPIITIVAMILLMVMVNILNLIFWWKPLFKWCFPLNVKAGGS